MTDVCAVIPLVFNKKGKIVDSRLFQDLLSFLNNNREEAVRIYSITKNPDFIRDWNPRLILDDNNEPTIASLLKLTNLRKFISDEKVLEELNRKIGYYKKGTNRPALWLNTEENYLKLLKKAINFNKNSEFKDDYVARVILLEDSESTRVFRGIKIFKKTKEYAIEASKMEYNESLNERLREILASYGISTGALTELEQRMGINGVTDFDVAKNAATGLIEMIRLAEGIQGERALPEEFAHFIIEALGDNPLINRLINHLHSTGLVKEILGEKFTDYQELYELDAYRLAKEAAGKILAKHLLLANTLEKTPYKNILQRVIEAVKLFFRKMRASDIQKAIYEADKEFGTLAKDILTGNMDDKISLDNINNSGTFYLLADRTKRDKKILLDIIDNELKRLNIYEKRNPKSSFGASQRLFIDKLETELSDNNEIEGIYSFIDNALEELLKIKSRMNILNSTDSENINNKASVLRDIRNYLYSYSNVLEDIRVALLDEERYQDNRYGSRVRVALDNATILIKDLFADYNKLAMPLFILFLKPFLGENVVVPFGKFKGQSLKVEDLIKVANEDISFFDRWLDSMADSSDHMLKLMDQAVKKSKEIARLQTIEVLKKLQAAKIELELSGIKDTKWMFELDSKGNLSGNYISEINYALYQDERKKMIKRLNEKYGKNPVGLNAENYKKERKAWYDANLDEKTKLPKKSIYENKVYANLSAAQKKYYNTVIEIKKDLDKLLPEKATSLYNAVKIRKDLIERVKSSEGVLSGASLIWESIKDDFVRRSDDVDFGYKSTVKDFEGNIVQTLPIYYINMKEGENMNDLSTDITSTMAAYASMANDFNEMNRVIDVLELGRDLLKERKITQTQGDKPLMESFKTVGRKVEKVLTKSGDSTRFMERLNDFFDMLVYGRYMADEGTFGKTNIDKGKVANFVNKVTSLNNLALNVLSGISNVITGNVMMRIESFAKEFFTEKDTIVADRIYGLFLPGYLAEIGSRIKTNKLALWQELFNTLLDYEENISNLNFDRLTWFSKMFSTNTLFFMNNAGEHWMQNRTSLALANTYKMKSPQGKIVSLWDAMEVVYLDNNKKTGAKLQIKEGYTKEDGSAFTDDDVIKFSRKSAAINQRMHGIYNKADRSAVLKLAIGRMGIMFRKWIKPSLNRRFDEATYNYDLEAWTEGYYRTTGRFFMQLVRDLRETQFNLGARWNDLTTTEKANIKRALTETGHFLAVILILGLIEWSDDKDRPWLVRMTEYQARRLYTELGALIPGKSMVSEGLKILKSPAAGINTIEDMLNLTKLLYPGNYTDEIQSGRYKGHSTAYKSFFESPIIPMNKTIYRGLHPEELIPFFKQ